LGIDDEQPMPEPKEISKAIESAIAELKKSQWRETQKEQATDGVPVIFQINHFGKIAYNVGKFEDGRAVWDTVFSVYERAEKWKLI